MNQIQQARQGLLIYLQANNQYIQQKVYNQFNVECIELQTINKLNTDKLQRVIKEIFDFGNNHVYNYFFTHIKSNTKNYIKKAYDNKAIDSFYVLDIQKLIDIVKYCINNGFNEEEIQKEKKRLREVEEKKKMKEADEKKRLKEAEERKKRVYIIEEPQVKEPPKDQFAYVKPKVSSFLDKDKIPVKKQFVLQKHTMPELNAGPKISTFLDKDKIPKKKQFIIQKYTMPELNTGPKVSTFLDKDKIPVKKQFVLQKFTMPDTNVLPRYLANIPKPSPPKVEQQAPNPVAPLQTDYLLAHKKILRQRLQRIFNFYCQEQQNIGVGATFDRIKSNGQKMSLGKFMQFCQYTKLFSSKQITKDMLMLEFKKNCQGKIQIPFQLFQKLIIKLDEKYLNIMKHDPVNNPIATYEARLLLNQPDKIKQLKRHRHLIFGTKDKQGRQIKGRSLSDRYTKKQLTAHSGIFSSDLQQLIKDKHETPLLISQKQNSTKITNQSYIQLNQLQKLKLPKLNWILQQQQNENPHKINSKR